METLNENAISKHENTILMKQLNISSKQKRKTTTMTWNFDKEGNKILKRKQQAVQCCLDLST